MKRLAIVYVPNGRIMNQWTPAAVGDDFELTPLLKPLATFRDRFVVLSGLSQEPRGAAGPAGRRARAPAGAYLTGSPGEVDRRQRLP